MKNAPFIPLFSALLADSPLGSFTLTVSEKGLREVLFGEKTLPLAPVANPAAAKILENGIKQLSEYLAGQRQDFNIPIDWECLRPFQRKALEATYAIPFGEVRTYGQVAAAIGAPKAPRAVGRAQATNPMPIIIPCHRVIGGDGSLHGYGGKNGLKTKAWLLKLEGHDPARWKPE